MRRSATLAAILAAGAVLAAASPAAAMYHPTLGRWLSRDPLAQAGSGSPYEYGSSQPHGTVDPTGCAPIEVPPSLRDLFKERAVNPDDGDRSRTHGTKACAEGECCEALTAKLAQWVLHVMQRSYEMFLDKGNLWSDPAKAINWQMHQQQLNIALQNMKRCFDLAVGQCRKEQKPPPPSPPQIPVRDPTTRTYPLPPQPKPRMPIVITPAPQPVPQPRPYPVPEILRILVPLLIRVHIPVILMPTLLDPW
ncbi:MAG: hypothetical protein FJ288_18730, partial [Planctomycetes bacterium]|nr:hypothetical protein [Planctomycetota bacterium]